MNRMLANRMLTTCVLCAFATGAVRDSLAVDYTKNYIPNGSFEKGSSVEGQYQCKINDNPESPATESWSGGIVTVGSMATFCEPAVLDGMYALALHVEYPEATATFSLPRDGFYELSYLLTCRHVNGLCYGQTLHVYFDDETRPASVRTPSSYSDWIAVTNRSIRLSAGHHRIRLVGVTVERAWASNPSVVVDNLRLTCDREPDVLENGGFELYDGVAPEDYAVNGENGFQALHWTGGIVTRGENKEFCWPAVADGSFAMALHYAYPVISNRFDVIDGGTYELSFRTISRSRSVRCQQTVSVYFDDEMKPLCSVLPTSTSSWDSWSFSCRLTKGEHIIRFVGVTPNKPGTTDPVDSSTVIDDVQLTLRKRSGGLVVAIY